MNNDRKGMPTLSGLMLLAYIGAAFGVMGAIALWGIVRYPINHLTPSRLRPFFFGRGIYL